VPKQAIPDERPQPANRPTAQPDATPQSVDPKPAPKADMGNGERKAGANGPETGESVKPAAAMPGPAKTDAAKPEGRLLPWEPHPPAPPPQADKD